MPLETVVHIGDLVVTNPASNDPKSQGDDHLRNIKTALANDFAGYTGAVCVAGADAGVVNAYALATAAPLPAYGTKMAAVFSPVVTNNGPSTLNISGLGPKVIRRIDGTDVIAGDLVAGLLYFALYNGTEFRLVSVTKQYIDQLSFGASNPAQPGGSTTYFLSTLNGVTSWVANPTPDYLLMSQGIF